MFTPGDHVEKRGGDYSFAGVVVAAFKKLSGRVRLVVEDDRGVLFIFSEQDLQPRAGQERKSPTKNAVGELEGKK